MAETLGDVDELAAAVIALARIAFGVFVGEHRPLRLEHARARVILRGDELDVILLALALAGNGLGKLGIESGNGHAGVEHMRASLSVQRTIVADAPHVP